MKQTHYYITGTYFSETLDGYLNKYLQRAGSLFFHAEEAGDSVPDFFTVWTELLRQDPAFEHADILIIELGFLQYFKDLKNLSDDSCADRLANLIKTSFSAENVWIIHSHVPGYWVIDADLLRYYEKKPYSENAEILMQLEERLSGLCGGRLCGLTRYYFNKKRIGYKTDIHVFEDECYQDIANKIANSGSYSERDLNLPDYSMSLNRYIRYSGKTFIRDFPYTFFDMDQLLHRMIIACPPEFVQTYQEDFLLAGSMDALESMLAKSLNKNAGRQKRLFRMRSEERNLEDRFSKTFIKRLVAFYAVDNGRWNERYVDYAGMFRDEIVSIPISDIVKKYAERENLAEQRQINRHNCGYYFALMTGKDEITAKSYVMEDTVLKPLLVDVYGSCISRTFLWEEYSGNRLYAIRHSWLQTPPYALAQPVVNYPKDLFDGLEEKAIRNTRAQFEHTLREDILKSSAEWLLTDLQSILTSHSYHYHGMDFVDFEDLVAARLGLKHSKELLLARIDGSWEDFFLQFCPWMDTIREKFQNRIILSECHCSPIFTGDDGKLYQRKDADRINHQYNRFYQAAFEYVKAYLDCYTITLSSDYYSDDRGYMNGNSLHFGYQYYQEGYQFIKEIIQSQPEKKDFSIPGRKKVYDLPELPNNYPDLHPLPKKRFFHLEENKRSGLLSEDSLIINSDLKFGRAFWTRWDPRAILNREEQTLVFDEHGSRERTKIQCWSAAARIDGDGKTPYTLTVNVKFLDLDDEKKFFCVRTFDQEDATKYSECVQSFDFRTDQCHLKEGEEQQFVTVLYPKGKYIKAAPFINRNGHIQYSGIKLKKGV